MLFFCYVCYNNFGDIMKINYFGVTFWFNIFEKHIEILENFRKKLGNEYQNFNIKGLNDNLLMPIITAINNQKMTNMSMSQINLQYNMDKVNSDNLEEFKNRVLEIFEILTTFGIEVLHTSLCINGEIIDDNALEIMTDKTLTKSIISEDLVDATLKFGKKEEDLFYKIITLLNKKQIKLPKKVDEVGRDIPIPLISWNGAMVEREMIDISYELNDKYSFDFTKNYHTTEFYLNKMLYVLINNYESDINDLLKKGEF